ncbi:NAD(P)H-dependent flavin oxidoreductase [Acidimangrovimonas sediminis]|uniref:NAD(P)H-dependent flavin oxidoreductase n=1 Tax=Acidimangrovimonas sediminis TaxID=2056283 RepID=UPI000C80EAC9|nr:nitronate monooxygenase [Acidimangrovimonas sediminis]
MLEKLGLALPIVQAPMAGVATPALAAAVSDAGGLGSIGMGATDARGARAMIEELRTRTARPFNVNLFVHEAPRPDLARDRAWLDALAPLFTEFGATPPASLRKIYKSFADDPEMLALMLEVKPAVVSLHFGLPPAATIRALKSAGILLVATATSPEEAQRIEDAGLDAIVAQGYEAGGHRGIFDPAGADDRLGTVALTRLLVRKSRLPVIAAGGIMDGAGIGAVLDLGAAAAQLGTAFISCPESAADAAYRAALLGAEGRHTRMTSAISGRPARVVANRFAAAAEVLDACPPDYPIAYDAGKALHAAASAGGEYGYGAQWAGQGAPLSRPMPAAELVATLARELAETRGLGAGRLPPS